MKLIHHENYLPGGGTVVTALHTAQQTEAAPIGYSSRFRQPEQTSWLCAPKFKKNKIITDFEPSFNIYIFFLAKT